MAALIMAGTELLRIWECGLGKVGSHRAVALLTATAREGADAVERLPPGSRDTRLLELREQLFGTRLTALAACAGCGDQLEFECEVNDLRPADDAAPTVAPLCVERDGVRVTFRLPDSRDLAALEGSRDVEAARRRLFERCILSVAHEDGVELAVNDCAEPVLAAVAERMSEADPIGDLRMELSCSECGTRFEAPFDIGSFLWTEVQTAAQRLLEEIHLLASAYGWNEAEILRLSPERRQAYLQLVVR